MSPFSQRWTLASASPRRLALLRQVGIEPEVVPAEIAESMNGLDPVETVLQNARLKAEAVRACVRNGVLLAADTLVVINGTTLGKPGTAEKARAQLESLSGTWHEVLTGFRLWDIEREKHADGVERTRVRFRPLSAREIEASIKSGEPFDKAGGYGIQGRAGAFVDRIEGCYSNVIGLPLARIMATLQAWRDE